MQDLNFIFCVMAKLDRLWPDPDQHLQMRIRITGLQRELYRKSDLCLICSRRLCWTEKHRMPRHQSPFHPANEDLKTGKFKIIQ
jgi:hypothetical protein